MTAPQQSRVWAVHCSLYFPSRKELKVSTSTGQSMGFQQQQGSLCLTFLPKLIYRFCETQDESPGGGSAPSSSCGSPSCPCPTAEASSLLGTNHRGTDPWQGNPEAQNQQVSLALPTLEPQSLLDLKALTPT